MTKREKFPQDVTTFLKALVLQYREEQEWFDIFLLQKRQPRLEEFASSVENGTYSVEREKETVASLIRQVKYYANPLSLPTKRELILGIAIVDPELIEALETSTEKTTTASKSAQYIYDFVLNAVTLPWGMIDLQARQKTFKLITAEMLGEMEKDSEINELTDKLSPSKVFFKPDYSGKQNGDYERYERIKKYLESIELEDPYSILERWCGMTMKGTYFVYIPTI